MKLTPKGLITILVMLFLMQSCSNPEASLDTEQSYKIDSMISVEEAQAHLGKNADELFEILSRELKRVTVDSVDYYVVEGDILMDADELYMYCGVQLKNFGIDTASIGKRIRGNQFTVAIRPDGSVAKWPNGYRLRYAVLRRSFQSDDDYRIAVDNMQHAVNDWQGICNIFFDYKSNYDELSPGSTAPDLDFVVRGINANGAFIAQAFFPGDPPMKRRVLIDPSYYHANFDRIGIFRHELGHVLGARHEHIWSNDEDCKGERVVEGYLGADSLTPYDRYSVMHYLCGNSSGTRELAFTSFDTLGARKLYGPPTH